MGAANLEIVADNPEAAWAEFERARGEFLEDHPDSVITWPSTKKEALEQMAQDGPDAEGKVRLKYRIKM